MNKLLATLACLSFLTLATGCGRADIGDSCDRPGNPDECVSEAMCTQNANGSATCLRRCIDDTQCAATEACNGVASTNIKTCQPK